MIVHASMPGSRDSGFLLHRTSSAFRHSSLSVSRPFARAPPLLDGMSTSPMARTTPKISLALIQSFCIAHILHILSILCLVVVFALDTHLRAGHHPARQPPAAQRKGQNSSRQPLVAPRNPRTWPAARYDISRREGIRLRQSDHAAVRTTPTSSAPSFRLRARELSSLSARIINPGSDSNPTAADQTTSP
jgi:hypothetical protein